MNFPVRNLFFFLVFVGGGVWLQIFLSKAESKWPGLILPFICFSFSLLAALNVAVPPHNPEGAVAVVLPIFLLFNIPTAVLTAIYLACRERIKKHRQIDKMNIQDL